MKIIVSDIRQFDSEFSFKEALNKLDKKRISRINSLKSPEDKKRSLTAGLLINYAMRELNINSEIKSDSHGKLFWDNNSELFFNISHSGNFATIAYGNTPVGIDIQKFRNINDGVAKRFLSTAEYEVLQACDSGFTSHFPLCANNDMAFPHDCPSTPGAPLCVHNDMASAQNKNKQQYLNTLWSIKEAYIKLTGLGLFYDMRQCVVNMMAGTISEFAGSSEGSVSQNPPAYKQTAFVKHFSFISDNDTYNLSVCSHQDNVPNTYRLLNFKEMTN